MSTATQTIRELVSTQSSAAAVLQRFDIDLCSHADASLQNACNELQLSVDQVLEKLADAAANEPGARTIDVCGYSQERLIQHIVRTHHQTVRRELPRLSAMAHKLAAKHGERAPELKTIEGLVEMLRLEMLAHLEKEEQVLFPFIAQMEEEATGGSHAQACFRSVAQPIAMMEQEHDSAESLLSEMRKISKDFAPPAWACATYIAFYAGLDLFADDLRQHVHLENDILFPRAIATEAALRQQG